MKTLYVYVADATPCEEALKALVGADVKSRCMRPDMNDGVVEYTITTESESLIRMLHALAAKATWEIHDGRYELQGNPKALYVYFGMGSVQKGLVDAHKNLLEAVTVNHCAGYEYLEREDLGPDVAQYRIEFPDSWLSTLLMNLKHDPAWHIFEGRLNTL